jgi:BirA family biotin operon repressor/biotin-[acetyl-CoA-carboxylase] ligase
MTPESVRNKLRSKVVGRRVACVDRCESTNDLAWKAALAGEDEGLAIFAEEQTKGRGRFGRTWAAGRGQALLLSVLLRPELPSERLPLMTALGALAVTDVVGDDARIRFPNDVMLRGLKVAGILVEARYVSARPDAFIVGIGVNVTGHPDGVGATSLGATVSRPATARALLEALDDWYGRIHGNLRDYRKAWKDRSFIIGKRVRIRQNGKPFEGVVEEVDPLDGLVVRLDSGHPREVRAEHVEHLEVLK